MISSSVTFGDSFSAGEAYSFPRFARTKNCAKLKLFEAASTAGGCWDKIHKKRIDSLSNSSAYARYNTIFSCPLYHHI